MTLRDLLETDYSLPTAEAARMLDCTRSNVRMLDERYPGIAKRMNGRLYFHEPSIRRLAELRSQLQALKIEQ